MAVSRGGGEYSQEFSKEPLPCRHASADLLTVAKFLERIADHPFPFRLGSEKPNQGEQEPGHQRAFSRRSTPAVIAAKVRCISFSARAPSGHNSKYLRRRPSRTSVDSPIQDRTSPFCSSRS